MAYDEDLAERIRFELEGTEGLTERKMFGGLGFMVHGNMAVAAGSGGSLMVRVDPADAPGWCDGPHVAPMQMQGRALNGWLLVERTALEADAELALWIGRGLAYVATLPPK